MDCFPLRDCKDLNWKNWNKKLRVLQDGPVKIPEKEPTKKSYAPAQKHQERRVRPGGDHEGGPTQRREETTVREILLNLFRIG